jgi:hypothetical protein
MGIAVHIGFWRNDMKVLGVEISGNDLIYVLISSSDEGVEIIQIDKLKLGSTRTSDSLRSFQSAVNTVLNDAEPELIGIKEKPEKGNLSAGSAALKMEGILLASSRCVVDFVSGKRINSCSENKDLKKYQQPAFKAAIAALKKANG